MKSTTFPTCDAYKHRISATPQGSRADEVRHHHRLDCSLPVSRPARADGACDVYHTTRLCRTHCAGNGRLHLTDVVLVRWWSRLSVKFQTKLENIPSHTNPIGPLSHPTASSADEVRHGTLWQHRVKVLHAQPPHRPTSGRLANREDGASDGMGARVRTADTGQSMMRRGET